MDSNSPIVKDKSQSNLRWLILLLNCFMMMGAYYASDIPAALHTPLEDWMGSNSSFENNFALLYSVYSIPNIVLPFFGGFFVDKLGVRVCLMTFAFCLCVGQVIFAVGLSAKSWPVMFLGRVLFGCGAESLGVGQGATLSQWFKGKEVAFAFGLSLSVARLGSVTNNFVSPSLATSTGIVFAGWFGAILCGVSLACAVFIGIISKRFEAYEEKAKEESLLQNKNNDDDEEVQINLQGDDKKEPPVQFRDIFKFGIAFWVITASCVIVYGCVLPFNNVASALLMERNYFVETPSGCELMDTTICQSSVNKPDDGCPSESSFYKYQPPLPSTISASDIDCQDSAWKDEGTCGYYYCKDQADGIKSAATVMSIPYIISAVLSPFLGGFVDKFGLRAVIATIAPAALVIVHSCLGFSNVDPVGPMVGQGLAYSAFAAVLWPSIPLVVEPRYTGLGYGIVTSVQNGGLALFPIIIAKIANDHGGEYIPYAELFFISCGALGFVIGLYLNYYDYHHNSIFNKPTSTQTKYEALDSDENRDNAGEITVAYDNTDSKTISKIVSSNDTTINALHDK